MDPYMIAGIVIVVLVILATIIGYLVKKSNEKKIAATKAKPTEPAKAGNINLTDRHGESVTEAEDLIEPLVVAAVFEDLIEPEAEVIEISDTDWESLQDTSSSCDSGDCDGGCD